VPFTAPAPVDIILKHLHDPPVPPRQLRADLQIAPELQRIVLRCMAKAASSGTSPWTSCSSTSRRCGRTSP